MPQIDLDCEYQQTDLYLVSRDAYAKELRRRGKIERCDRCLDWFDDPAEDTIIVHDKNGDLRTLCMNCNEKEESE